MPIHLPPLSGSNGFTRRRFLLGVGGGLAAVLGGLAPPWPRSVSGQQAPPAAARPRSWALLSDPHIDASLAATNQGQNMASNLLKVIADVIGEGSLASVINGDLSRIKGDAADYASFLKLLVPLRASGASVHLTLGNHDDRESFLRVAGAEVAKSEAAIPGKYVTRADVDGHRWVLLDSLDRVNEVPGSLQAAQLAWLAKTLDEDARVPAVIFVHHNVERVGSGLLDTDALLDVLGPRRQVKAIFFGHTHVWKRWTLDGIHFVNLPAVGYAFGRGEPLGWVRAQPRPGGLTLELRSLDGAHAEHRQPIELEWRA